MKAKQVFSTILSSPVVLFRRFKKIKLDSFVGGLVFGAIFSLIVNVITVQFQEMITKQKYLESLEREIVSHLVRSSVIKEDIEESQASDDSDPLVLAWRYDTAVWDSTDILGYIYDLESSKQAEITAHYSFRVSDINRTLDYIEDSMNQLEFDAITCYLQQRPDEECAILDDAHYEAAQLFEGYTLQIADRMHTSAQDLLEDFHPTQDRLDNWVLRILMGDEVTYITNVKQEY